MPAAEEASTCVNHSRAHVGMPKQLLHAPNVDTGVQQVRGERVSKGVRRDSLWNLRAQCLRHLHVRNLVRAIQCS
jgi:hypothetical protein